MTEDLNELKAEREQLERAIAERQKQIDKAATMQWCEERASRGEEEPCGRLYDAVNKRMPTERRANDVSADWQNYIRREIDRVSKGWVEAQMSAVGEVLAEMRKEFEQKLRDVAAEAVPGRDGISIVGAEINRKNELMIVLSNGTVLTPGRLKEIN